jgi:hypothetical protein
MTRSEDLHWRRLSNHKHKDSGDCGGDAGCGDITSLPAVGMQPCLANLSGAVLELAAPIGRSSLLFRSLDLLQSDPGCMRLSVVREEQ